VAHTGIHVGIIYMNIHTIPLEIKIAAVNMEMQRYAVVYYNQSNLNIFRVSILC
jgi:hypothetical protein